MNFISSWGKVSEFFKSQLIYCTHSSKSLAVKWNNACGFSASNGRSSVVKSYEHRNKITIIHIKLDKSYQYLLENELSQSIYFEVLMLKLEAGMTACLNICRLVFLNTLDQAV